VKDFGALTGRIQAAGGDGVGEAHAAAQQQRVLAERDCARMLERIAALQLLRDTVCSCLAEGRERYYEPVRRHLHPFLNDLFPGAELELGDGFTITGMKRSRSESFKRLSGGTAERGGNVPVILDDALVYCDDDCINLKSALAVLKAREPLATIGTSIPFTRAVKFKGPMFNGCVAAGADPSSSSKKKKSPHSKVIFSIAAEPCSE